MHERVDLFLEIALYISYPRIPYGAGHRRTAATLAKSACL